MKKALIIGILGQDGSYMAEHLSSKHYEVYGIVRENTAPHRIREIESLVPTAKIIVDDVLDKKKLNKIIREVSPHEVYNFAGVTNVFNAWENLDDILTINARLPQNILETIFQVDKSIRFFQASSCLTFGKDNTGCQNENTPPQPIYPYGISKLYADNMVKEFRSNFSLYCCSGIFFNHESSRRQDGFFSKKAVVSAVKIWRGLEEKMKVGNLSALRDYGYAPDFVEAAHLMLNNTEPRDYVIGTGRLISMEDFLRKCFEAVGLDYKNHMIVDPDLYRNNDTNILKADISRISSELGWHPKHTVEDMIAAMIKEE